MGYGPEIIDRVRDLNLKKNFPADAESRVLEDALCLVFLEFQFADLAGKTDEDKIVNAAEKLAEDDAGGAGTGAGVADGGKGEGIDRTRVLRDVAEYAHRRFDGPRANCYTFRSLFIVKSRNAWYAGLILLVLLAVVVRIRLLALPLERDEGEFAYAGQLMLQGIAPYKLAFNMKMPGTYAAYAVLMGVFGQSPSGIHLGFLLVNLGTLGLLFLLARRLLEGVALPVCCAAYVLLSLSPAVLGLEGHATHLVVLHALGGLLLLLRARQSGRASTLFFSGLLFGLAFLCKQPGLFFGVFAVALLLRDAMAARPVSWRAGARNIAWLSLGMVLPLALTCLALWRAGTFGRFWFWTVPYARVYGGLQSLPDGLDRLQVFFAFGSDRWCYLTGTLGLLGLFWRKAGAEQKFFFTALFFCSFFATAAGLYFRGHYFILMLPVICLLIGDAVTRLADALGRTRRPWLRAAPAALFVAAGAWLAWQNRAVWFELPMARGQQGDLPGGSVCGMPGGRKVHPRTLRAGGPD